MMALPEGFVDDDIVIPAMEKLLACAERELVVQGVPMPVRKGLYPGGETPMDSCGDGDCGQLYVRLVVGWGASNPPAQNATAARCGNTLVFQLELGVARCAPQMDAQGNPPSVEALWEATRLQMADMRALKRAIECCYPKDDDDDHAVMIGNYTPLPPSGDCVGGYWTVTLW